MALRTKTHRFRANTEDAIDVQIDTLCLDKNVKFLNIQTSGERYNDAVIGSGYHVIVHITEEVDFSKKLDVKDRQGHSDGKHEL